MIKHRCIQSKNIRNGYHSCPCWIHLYWVYRDQRESEWKNETIYPTGKHWLNHGIVQALPVYAEREDPGWFIAARTCEGVSLAIPVWSLPLCLVLHFVCPRSAISSFQNKSTASHRHLCLQASSCCLKLSFHGLSNLMISQLSGYMYWQGWIELDPIFVWKCGSVSFFYYFLPGKLEHIYTEKQQESNEDNGSNHVVGDEARRMNAG